MTTQVKTRVESRIATGEESAKFVVGAIGGISLLIGTWGLVCLIGGLVSSGPVGLIQGYISAITGI